MEFDENNYSDQEEFVEIYSKKAIFWFAVFSPLYAAILLIINLWVAGFKAVVAQVVVFILGWAFLTYMVEQRLAQAFHISNVLSHDPKLYTKILYVDLASLGLNVACGAILTGFFFRKYFPDNDYYPRSIQVPLFIFIGFLLFTLLFVGRSL